MVNSSNFKYARAYHYSADAFSTVDMVVSAVYALIFLVLAVLSIVVLVISRGHRSTYIPLHISLLAAFIHSGVSFSLLIVAANGAAIPSPGLLEGLDVFASFVSFWSFALLFLTFCYILRDRFNAINAFVDGAMGTIPFVLVGTYYSIFGLLLIFGTTAAALFASYSYTSTFGVDSSSSAHSKLENDIEKRFQAYKSIYYTFVAVLSLSGLAIAALTTLVYRSMKKASVYDKVTKALMFAGSPLYIILVIVTLSFTVAFSPVGVEGVDALERVSVADTFLANAAYTAIAALLVILGVSSPKWSIRVGTARKDTLLMRNVAEQLSSESAYYTPSHIAYEPYITADTSYSDVHLKGENS